MPRPDSARSVNSTIVRFRSVARGAVALLSRLAPGPAAAVAERLFFTAPRPRPSRGEAFLRSGRRCDVGVGGRHVVAWRFGRGPSVLLVHGWAGRAAQLSGFVAPLLARGFSVVAFDAPGHGGSHRGLSSAVDFARAMRALEREHGPLHAVIAHSLGAAATALALDAGLRARRCVFLGPAASPPRWASAFAERLGLPEEVVSRMRARSEHRLGLNWAQLDVPMLATRRAEPLLVVHDRQDAEVPVADGRRIASAWPGARFVPTVGLGHQRLLRDPAVIEQTVAFVSEDAPDACPCGAATPESCEGCRMERVLFDREARWAGAGGASIASWSSGWSVLPSTSAP